VSARLTENRLHVPRELVENVCVERSMEFCERSAIGVVSPVHADDEEMAVSRQRISDKMGTHYQVRRLPPNFGTGPPAMMKTDRPVASWIF
jgi:hypothetical protein